jgi:large subunit ribosomal protein L21
MFAVIKTGGKQYKVQQGDVLQVEKLSLEKDKAVTFEEVLLVEDGEKTLIGTPFVETAKVHAVVIENFKDDKVIIFKKKKRKQYKKMRGHRQELSRVRIENITIGTAAPKKAPPAADVKKEEPVKTKPAAKKPAAAKASVPKKAETKKPEKSTKAPASKATKSKSAASKPKAAPKKAAAAKPAAPSKTVTKTKEK